MSEFEQNPYGPPRPERQRRSGPRPLTDALAGVRMAATPPTLLGAVQQVWMSALGKGLAEHAEAVSEQEGSVTVACDSAVWAGELELMSAELLERLNASLAAPLAITRLRFISRPD